MYDAEVGEALNLALVRRRLCLPALTHCLCLVFPLPSFYKTAHFPCVFTAGVAKTLSLPCISTVFVAKTLPFPCGRPGHGRC